MKRIGLLGGTFNPIHNGHLELAEIAMNELKLDEVWFVISNYPPHKSDSDVISSEHRLAMTKLAIKNNPLFKLCDIELNREGKSYTVDTLKELKYKYPENEFSFIIGQDSLINFNSWYKPDEICKLASLIVAKRKNSEIINNSIDNEIDEIKRKFKARINLLEHIPQDISSSVIRNLVFDYSGSETPKAPFNKDSVSPLHELKEKLIEYVPDLVADYIINYRLYREYFVTNEEIEEIKEKLQETLDYKRYVHSLGVAYMAAALGMRYNMDENKLMLAGLLHDCGKLYPNKPGHFHKYIEDCEKYGIEISEAERKAPGLLHAKLGAYFAKERYGIYDEEVLSSIRWHTTGRAKMTDFENIIYVADFIDPHRRYTSREELSKLNRMAFEDSRLLFAKAIVRTINHLKKNDLLIDDTTLEAYEWVKSQYAINEEFGVF